MRVYLELRRTRPCMGPDDTLFVFADLRILRCGQPLKRRAGCLGLEEAHCAGRSFRIGGGGQRTWHEQGRLSVSFC